MNQMPIMPVTPQYQYPIQNQQAQQKYNAVNIEISNPSVGAPGQQPMTYPIQQPVQQPDVIPYYQYPQAPIYQYPQAPQMTYPQPVEVQPAPAVQNINYPQPVEAQPVAVAPVATTPVPAPQVSEPTTEAPKVEAKPEVVEAQQVNPQFDINAFIAKLSDPDFDTQAACMNEIPATINNNPEKANELVDTKVFDALNNIIAFDSSKLEGPTAEQEAVRQKSDNNEPLTEAEQKLAELTPKEKAERNKCLALFAEALIQKLYCKEMAKLQNGTLPTLTDIPGIMTVVNSVKDNENPIVRASAIESLDYIKTPEYKKDLETVFNVAQNDADPRVVEAAKKALDELAKI